MFTIRAFSKAYNFLRPQFARNFADVAILMFILNNILSKKGAVSIYPLVNSTLITATGNGFFIVAVGNVYRNIAFNMAVIAVCGMTDIDNHHYNAAVIAVIVPLLYDTAVYIVAYDTQRM